MIGPIGCLQHFIRCESKMLQVKEYDTYSMFEWILDSLTSSPSMVQLMPGMQNTRVEHV